MMSLYVIGSVIAIIVLAVQLRKTCDQLSRVARERDAYARTIEMITPQGADLPARPADDYALPPARIPAGRPDRRPAQ
jgi:hypothetical protein